MLLTTKAVLKELLICLVMLQVVWILIPRPLKNIITGTTRTLSKGCKGITYHTKKYVNRSLKQRKKATPTRMEQPQGNVIQVIYPNRCVKRYYKVK